MKIQNDLFHDYYASLVIAGVFLDFAHSSDGSSSENDLYCALEGENTSKYVGDRNYVKFRNRH